MGASGRIIIIGTNSMLWARMRDRPVLAERPICAVGHRTVGELSITPEDHIWILSYSPDETGNAALIEQLAGTQGRVFHYVSSATANVALNFRCFRYPRVKARAEALAAERLGARIVRIGMIYDEEDELPAGSTAATEIDDIVEEMVSECAQARSDGIVHLYRMIERPFRNHVEYMVFRAYGWLQSVSGSRPCLLRPLDLALRAAGCRWYGYVYLSNRLCTMTTY